MLISHQHKFIFIHIFKTAGSSVADVLAPHVRLLDRLVYDYSISKSLIQGASKLFKLHDSGMKHFTGFHKHATAYEVLEKMGMTKFNCYFKFTFVRNPFDLLVSLYHYNKPKGTSWADYPQFNEFVRNRLKSKAKKQYDFIVDPTTNEILVNYIGRFETLTNDLTKIQDRLEVNLKRNLKHLNATSSRKTYDYKSFYDEETKKHVLNEYKDELELFGYNFNGYIEEMPINKKIKESRS